MRELYLLDESTLEGTSWQDHARCASVDPEILLGQDISAAVEVCRWCSVKAECLAYAEKNDERFGVWGGVDRSTIQP